MQRNWCRMGTVTKSSPESCLSLGEGTTSSPPAQMPAIPIPVLVSNAYSCWQFPVRIVEPSTPCDSYTSSVMSFIEVEEPSVSVNLTRSEKATRVALASFLEKFHWTVGSHSIQSKVTLNCRDGVSLTQSPNFCWTHPQLVLSSSSSLYDQSRHSER